MHWSLCTWDRNVVIIVSTDVLVPDVSSPSVNTVLTAKLDITFNHFSCGSFLMYYHQNITKYGQLDNVSSQDTWSFDFYSQSRRTWCNSSHVIFRQDYYLILHWACSYSKVSNLPKSYNLTWDSNYTRKPPCAKCPKIPSYLDYCICALSQTIRWW